MAHPTKIATCCYCGTRAALVLTGKTRHELACSGCGAPLHDLKAIRVAPQPAVRRSHKAAPPPKRSKPRKPQKSQEKYRKSKRKGGFRRFLEEAFDVIEDVFD